MHDNFATSNKLGLPLTSPSRQTILPVMCGGNGNLRGFLTIPATTFAGTETSYTTADGPIAITTVTLPPKVSDGSGYGVKQYMAAVFDDDVERLAPWLGYTAFVDVIENGYAMRWVQPVQGSGYIFDRGTLVTNLLVAMDELTFAADVVDPPDVTNGTLRWATVMQLNSASLPCAFFDFNWVDLFKAQSERSPLRIEIVANPVGGEFKSTIVPYPAVQPTGGIEFNTVRIIKLQDPAAGAYVFTYKVWDDLGQSTPCTLTLTVV